MKDTDREMIAHVENSPFFIGERGIKLDENSFLTNIPIDKIKFNVRFYHVISERHFKYLTDVLNTNYNKILIFRNCGIKSISDAQKEIRNFIVSEGYDITKSLNKNSEDKNECMELTDSVLGLLSPEEKNKFDEISDLLLKKLPISTRLKRFLADNPHIKTIKNISEINPNIFKKTKNLGRKTYLDTKEMILNLLKKDAKELVHMYSDKKMPILDLIDLSLKELSQRDLGIVIKRWGDKEINSLQFVADEYEITRERIRQIIDRVIKQIKFKIQTHVEFYRKQFLSIILIHPEAIAFERLEDYPLIKREYDKKIYLGILAEIFEEVPFRGFLSKAFDQYLHRNLRENIRIISLYKILSNTEFPYSKISAEDIFIANNITNSLDKLLLFKILISSQNFKFIYVEGKYCIIKLGSLQEITKNILAGSTNPLDITSILDIIKKNYALNNKYEDFTSVISNIKQNREIIQFDRYVFGLEKHFSYPREQWKNICDSIKEAINKSQRQTNVVELLEYVSPKFPKLRSKYELVHIIRSDQEIIDLGFFNFGLINFGITERLKISDEIKNIFSINPCPKHFTEIQKEISKKRFSRIEGINCILNSLAFLFNYSGGFFGLRTTHRENLHFLARNESYLTNLIDYELFPSSGISQIIKYFENTIPIDQLVDYINECKILVLFDDNNFIEAFVVSKRWSTVKIVRCILFNSKEQIYWDELLWLLKDIGLTLDSTDKSKIKKDRYIKIIGNKLSYINFQIQSEDSKVILNECYNLLLNTSTMWSLDKLNSFINQEFIDINYDELEFLLNDDDRFIIIDNKFITVK